MREGVAAEAGEVFVDASAERDIEAGAFEESSRLHLADDAVIGIGPFGVAGFGCGRVYVNRTEFVDAARGVCTDDGGGFLADLTLDEMRAELPNVAHLIGEDVFDYLTLEGSVASRNHPGGTAPEQVERQLAQAKNLLEASNGSG